jgi:hypothetical protein
MYLATPRFSTYQEFYDDFKRCRRPELGRPIKQWCRLYKDGRDFVVKQVSWGSGPNHPLFRVSPDNIITFELPLERLLTHSHTITSSLWRIVPVSIERKRKGIYAIAGTNTPAAQQAQRFDYVSKQGAEYFRGIQFNLLTGECLNAQPDMMDTVIPEMRKQWLRDVKRFKKGLKIRAKMGALQGFIRIVATERANAATSWTYNATIPKWEHPDVTQQVLECLRTEEYTPEILKLLVQTVRTGWRSGPEITDQMVLDHVDLVFDQHSLHFRKAYGVFGETLHVKS